MKKVCTFILITLVSFVMLNALESTTPASDNSLFRVNDVTHHYTEITFELDNYETEKITENGIEFTKITHPNAGYTIDAGYPELPVFSVSMAVPNQGHVSYEIVSETLTDDQYMNIYPSQGITLDGSQRPFQYNSQYYRTGNAGEVKLQSKYVLGEPGILRDFRMATFSVSPFVVSPETHELKVVRRVTFRVITNEMISGTNEITEERPLSRSFQNFYNAAMVNYQEFLTLERPNAEYQNRSLLIVYPQNPTLGIEVDYLAEWKRMKGFNVTVVNTGDTGVGSTNSSIKNYVQGLYNTAQNPPEYLMIVGDAEGSISIGAFGQGDHGYTTLAGNDILPEVFVGRMSIDNVTEFTTIASKIDLYECTTSRSVNPYDHTLLVGDTSPSGLSCVLTCRYTKERILDYDPGHTFTELYDGNPSENAVDAALDAGVLFFFYRGYIGMSNWDSSNINGLNNTNMPFNAVINTCDTGTITSTYSEARTELVVRKGTPSSPKGAVCAIGMATSGTHTQLNNTLSMGTMHGLYQDNMHTMGEAIMRGKLMLYTHFVNVSGATSYIQDFTEWNNLIGDPSMDVWRAAPIGMTANYDSSIPENQNHINVNVLDENNNPIEGAWVSITNSTLGISENVYTDNAGQAVVPIENSGTGTVNIVITKPDYEPIVNTFQITNSDMVAYNGMTVNDVSGNNDAVINPGEQVGINVVVENTSSSDKSNLSATLTTNNQYVTINQSSVTYSDINAGQTSGSQSDFTFTVAADAPHNETVDCFLNVTDGTDTWTSFFTFDIIAGHVDITNIALNGTQSYIDPGQTADLILTLDNQGTYDISNLQAEIYSYNGLLSVEDADGDFGTSIPIGSTGSNTANPFTVRALPDLLPGMQVEVRVRFFNNDFEQIETFIIPIGHNISQSDPTGPDAGGYVIFDESDTAYQQAPTYDWVEIDPSQPGALPGTNTGIVDNQDHNPNNEGLEFIEFFDLPFDFTFYGETYDRVGICSRGFITFGGYETQQSTFRNYPMPDAGGPSPMIAAFWDDMNTANGGIYYYYDAVNHRYIVEWSECASRYNNAEETFQIILYDPNYYNTTTGNGEFKIQWKVFNNVDGTFMAYGDQAGNYCTVGFEDHTETMGLQYTYCNQYPASAAPITNQSAIFVTGKPILHQDANISVGQVQVHDADRTGHVDAGETAQIGIELVNSGLTQANDVSLTLSSVSQYVTINQATSEYEDIPSFDNGYNVDPFEITVSPDCPDEMVIPFDVNVSTSTRDWTFSISIIVHKADVSMSSFMINDIAGNNDGKIDPGENADIIINFENASLSTARNVTATLTSSNTDINILNPQQTITTIGPEMIMQRAFNLSVSNGAQTGTSAGFTLTYSVDGGDDVVSQFMISIGAAGLSEDFESGNGGFTRTGDWYYGAANVSAHSGAFLYGTGLNWNYSNNSNSTLDTPDFFVGLNSQLSFWQNYNISAPYDGGNVKISVNNGPWQLLTPVGGYDGSTYASNAGIPQEPCFHGNSNGWSEVVIDLSSFEGNIVKIRWHFGADGAGTAAGWFIDDVNVTGAVLSSGKISGQVTLVDAPQNPDNDMDDVVISVGDFSANAESDGSYELYVAPGNYDIVTSLPGFSIDEFNNVQVISGSNLASTNFSLTYLRPVFNLQRDVTDHNLTLTWARVPDVDRLSFLYYRLYRKYLSGEFELVDSTLVNETWSETIEFNTLYEYYVVAEYDMGLSLPSDILTVNYDPTTANGDNDIPKFAQLQQNYPNPFNPETNIAFSLPQKSQVEIVVYNVKGEKVKTLVKESMDAGNHQVTWYGKNDQNKSVGSGVYFYKIRTSDFTDVKKAILLK